MAADDEAPRKKEYGDVTDAEWSEVFDNPEGLRFRNEMALMFSSSPPYSAPSKIDFRTYMWHLRDLYQKRHMVRSNVPGQPEEVTGLELLVRAFGSAGKVATERRPSPGSVRAHALALITGDALKSRALQPKPFVRPTPEQFEDLRRMRQEFLNELPQRKAFTWKR